MGSTIELFDHAGHLFGHFLTHLDPDQSTAILTEEGTGAFSDWHGDFLPTTPEEWRENDSLILCRDEEPWYRLIDQVGKMTQTDD